MKNGLHAATKQAIKNKERKTMFDILQLLGGIIVSFGYIPQIRQLARTKSCGDLNLKTFLSITIGIVLMELYAVDLVFHGSGLMYLITNTASLVITLTLCVMIIRLKYCKKTS
jgi:MtN3 and saliva related transmembrane protein